MTIIPAQAFDVYLATGRLVATNIPVAALVALCTIAIWLVEWLPQFVAMALGIVLAVVLKRGRQRKIEDDVALTVSLYLMRYAVDMLDLLGSLTGAALLLRIAGLLLVIWVTFAAHGLGIMVWTLVFIAMAVRRPSDFATTGLKRKRSSEKRYDACTSVLATPSAARWYLLGSAVYCAAPVLCLCCAHPCCMLHTISTPGHPGCTGMLPGPCSTPPWSAASRVRQGWGDGEQKQRGGCVGFVVCGVRFVVWWVSSVVWLVSFGVWCMSVVAFLDNLLSAVGRLGSSFGVNTGILAPMGTQAVAGRPM